MCDVIVRVCQDILGFLPEGGALADIVQRFCDFLLSLFNCAA
jgi:hypothetical protein